MTTSPSKHVSEPAPNLGRKDTNSLGKFRPSGPCSSTSRTVTEAGIKTMFNPPHPGLTLRDDLVAALGLTVTEAATQLDVDRTTLSKVLSGLAGISPKMVLRMERWIGPDNGGAAEVWLDQHTAYDLLQARQVAKS